jgi:hypothetical protein
VALNTNLIPATGSGQECSGSFLSPITILNNKQQQVFDKCKGLLNGFTYKEAEQILFELLTDIKSTSLITVL